MPKANHDKRLKLDKFEEEAIFITTVVVLTHVTIPKRYLADMYQRLHAIDVAIKKVIDNGDRVTVIAEIKHNILASDIESIIADIRTVSQKK